MGDSRFSAAYARLLEASDRAQTLARLTDEEVIEALAAASRHGDPLMANVLATEASNRMARSRAALRHMADGVLLVDETLLVVSLNPAAESLLGWRETDLRQADARVLLPTAASSTLDQDWVLARAIHEDAPVRCEETRLVRKDGRPLRVELTASPVRREGRVTGAVATFRPLPDEPMARGGAGAWIPGPDAGPHDQTNPFSPMSASCP